MIRFGLHVAGARMRGSDARSGSLFSYVDLEQRVPAKHPLRVIKAIVDDVLRALDTEFERLYEDTGRSSIAPERLLRASLLQAFYSVRSERQLMEQIDYNLLFRWFVGLGIDDAVWDHSTFSKNRDRLLDADVAAKFLEAVLRHAKVKRFLSEDHFSVDGTLVEAWASLKSFRAKDGRDEPPGSGRITLGADKGYDAASFVDELRQMAVTPHIARNDALTKTGKRRRSSVDGRTTRHPGYAVSQRVRKRIEEAFGWAKTVAGLAKTKLRGTRRIAFRFTFTMAAYNLIRMPRLLATV